MLISADEYSCYVCKLKNISQSVEITVQKQQQNVCRKAVERERGREKHRRGGGGGGGGGERERERVSMYGEGRRETVYLCE